MSWKSNTKRDLGLKVLIVILLPLFGVFGSCTTICDDCGGFPGGPHPWVTRSYDYTKGGLQITEINFNEYLSDSVSRIHDEWVTLQTQSTSYTRGWHLRSHLTQTRYPFPDSVNWSVRIWSHLPPANTVGFSLSLPDSVWAWTNDGRDYIELLDSNGIVVDTMHYGH